MEDGKTKIKFMFIVILSWLAAIALAFLVFEKLKLLFK